MARLDFVDASTPGIDAELVRVMQERRGGELLNLDRQLLHSAPLARGWNNYLGAIRTGGILDGGLREMVILLVANLNRAPYEFTQHEPVALQEGVPPSKIAGLAAWEHSQVFSQQERDAFAYTTAMTLHVQVPDEVFANVRRHFSPREMVELTATVAAYNMVSRFLEALQIETEGENS
ncbi:MAG: carboxymuconolactone decarboxylase family protein [Pseudomonadota bacterium]